jgi:hypothetical protein
VAPLLEPRPWTRRPLPALRKAAARLVATSSHFASLVREWNERFGRAQSVPGWPRRIVVVVLVALALALTVRIALVLENAPPIVVATAAFIISLAHFQLVAFRTYDAEICWRTVDYLWVSAAAGTILVATANLEISSQRNEIGALRNDLQLTGANTVNSVDELALFCLKIDESRHHVEGTLQKAVLLEALPNSLSLRYDIHLSYGCHELEDLTNTLKKEILLVTLPSGRSWLSLGLLPCEGGSLMIWGTSAWLEDHPSLEEKQYGSRLRDGICESASHIDNTRQALQVSEQRLERIRGMPWQRYLIERQNTVYWWYVALAFAVGIRLGKVTAEIKQRAAAKLRSPG